MRHLITFLVILFFLTSNVFGQETFFIKTERPSQIVKIGEQIWDESPFFTVASSDGFHQVIVKEKGFKDQYDFISQSANHIFTNDFAINVDTNIIAIVKPVQFELSENFELEVYKCDYTSYLKDLNHDGELSTIYEKIDSKKILPLVKPDPYSLVQATNSYHNATRGRYKFYTLGKINKLRIYQVELSETEHFIQVEIDSEWSVTRSEMENLPTYPFSGSSGKHVLINAIDESSKIINNAIDDAAMSAMFDLLSEQQVFLLGLK